MVENLKRFGVISSKRVGQVMEALDRGLFVPGGSSSAYADTPMPIGYNATISAPHMHATCLQLLEDKLQPGMRALDVGSGSFFDLIDMWKSSLGIQINNQLMFVGTGYLTGCFALMVGDEGRVVGVEHIPELVDMSIKNIEKSVTASFLKKGSLSLHVGGRMRTLSFELCCLVKLPILRIFSSIWQMEEKVGESLHHMMRYT